MAEKKNDSPATAAARPATDDAPAARRGGILRSLSARLLLLTAAFVFFGVMLIFLPTLSGYRLTWLKDRVAMAELATLAVSAAPDHMVSEPLREELLNSAGVLVVVVRTENARKLVLQSRRPAMAEARYDLRQLGWWRALRDTLSTLIAGGERVIVVIDRPPTIKAEFIELAMHERALYQALVTHAAGILRYALILALLAGIVIYLTLHWLLIRPVRRLGNAMSRFGAAPEQPVAPPLSGRRDEIGDLEQAFAAMQRQIRDLLEEKSRLAALGAAVSRISHELRNMLAGAHMISDRLAEADDPLVRCFAPKLLHSLQRAISFCSATLRYGRLREPSPHRAIIALHDVVDEVFASLPQRRGLRLDNRVPRALHVDADPDQLFRALFNLAHNAARALHATPPAAGAPAISISAREMDGGVEIIIADNGPGLPQKVREHLFEPFVAASAAHGGSGLGLAITHEIVHLHEGEIDLINPPPSGTGTAFRIFIPARLRMVGDAARSGGSAAAARADDAAAGGA